MAVLQHLYVCVCVCFTINIHFISSARVYKGAGRGVGMKIRNKKFRWTPNSGTDILWTLDQRQVKKLSWYMSWLECKLSVTVTYIWTLGPWLVVLFWKLVKHLGGRAQLKEVGCWEVGHMVYSPPLVLVWALCFMIRRCKQAVLFRYHRPTNLHAFHAMMDCILQTMSQNASFCL